jgi:predicted XRE-type DNA-binding protein
MKSKGSEEKAPHLTRGSVLDDLGFSPSDALEIKVKAEIYRDLLKHIKGLGLSQQELGAALSIHQPDVSNLLNGKVSRFRVGKLIQFAGKLNLEAQVKLVKPRGLKPASVPVLSKTRKKEPAFA